MMKSPNEDEVTPEMIEAGVQEILGELGGADVGGLFSARDLAVKVYLAMNACRARKEKPDL